MPRYVALLRGIAPVNPNMRNEKLREVFKGLGFTGVKTVISSGNVIFESPSGNMRELEEKIEKALPEQLGFSSTAIIRSRARLERLMREDPFQEMKHGVRLSLNVTFLKQGSGPDMNFPYKIKGRGSTILGSYDGAICTVTDLAGSGTPGLMAWLEKQFGREITTRTWKTVERILKAME